MGSYARKWPLAALPLFLSACAAATAAPPPTPAEASPDGLSTEEMEAIYRQRQEQSRTRFTPADVKFMTNMLHHHAQAVDLARMVPERTTTDAIRILAARIINAQMDEIAIMQRWLRERGQAVPELHEMGGRVMVHGHEGQMVMMPGMIPPAEVRALMELTGTAFDRRFLELMIRHHTGAVEMVRELFATDGALQDEDAFRFASDVQVDQVTEVNRMERMLEAMSGSGSRR